MISRVAENCFWLHRYMERVENTARMLRVNVSYLLDAPAPLSARWRPILIVAGEEARFREYIGSDSLDDGRTAQEYLVWDARCPVSVVNSLQQARENAHTIRETISLEAWTAVNAFWLWFRGGQGRRLFNQDADAFYERVRDSVHQFIGVCHDTMLHDEPFDFMHLGMLLERAGQTARILDIKYHNLGPTLGDAETPAEAAQWLAILRSCSGSEPFFKRGAFAPTGAAVAEFLLLEPQFPRSVLYCLSRAWHFLQRIRSAGRQGIGDQSARVLESLVRHLRGRTIDKLLKAGIHAELTYVVSRITELCEAVRADYFDVAAA